MAEYRGGYMERQAAGVQFGDLGRWLVHGMVGGVIAGIIFAMFEMLVELVIVGTEEAFWMPLRMIGAIGIGAEALEPAYSLTEAALAGAAIHIALSAVFGMTFALLLFGLWSAARTPALILAAGIGGGLLLWLVNFYIIAPAAGWDWFPDGSRTWAAAVGHAGYGLLLAAYLSAVAARSRP